MKKIVKILILCLSCIGACWLLPACSSAIEEPESGGGVDGYPASLTFHIAVPGAGTRAGDIPEREKIDQLRIIVVDKETNKVDYNRLHSFPYRDGSTYTIGLDKGGKKLLYLLANTEDLSGLVIPSKGDTWNDEVDDYVITSLPDVRLPFTSQYEVEVAEEEEEDTSGDENKDGDTPADGDGTTEGDTPEDVVPEIPEDYTCYIAIAAVKFSITFNNKTEDDIKVSDFKISSIADCSYLFPHNKEWNDWVENVTGDGAKEYFTKYEIPSGAEHDEFTVPIPSSENNSFTVTAKKGSVFGSFTIPDFYCHESKNNPFNDGQRYIIQFKIDDQPFISEIKTGSESLASLIRSTHVKITVNINSLEQPEDSEIIISGEIVDWNWLEEVTGDIEEVEEYPEPHN